MDRGRGLERWWVFVDGGAGGGGPGEGVGVGVAVELPEGFVFEDVVVFAERGSVDSIPVRAALGGDGGI